MNWEIFFKALAGFVLAIVPVLGGIIIKIQKAKAEQAKKHYEFQEEQLNNLSLKFDLKLKEFKIEQDERFDIMEKKIDGNLEAFDIYVSNNGVEHSIKKIVSKKVKETKRIRYQGEKHGMN